MPRTACCILTMVLQEKLAKYYQIASTCQLILTRVHAGEHRILRVIQAAEDLSQRVQEFGNQLPMLYASRLIMPLGRVMCARLPAVDAM